MFLRSRRESQATIDRLYGAIVAQAREPAFYAAMGVPDTPQGRFEMLVLHVHLLWQRLAEETEARPLGQAVFDRFCADMDASLRELGVGDLAVPRQMRAVGSAYYGRAAAYTAAAASPDDKELVAALKRNVYEGADGADEHAGRLARYVRRAANALSAQETAPIRRGSLAFPQPEED